MMEWKKGAPEYDSEKETLKKDRYVWLQLHDQGGHPFVVLGYLHGEHTDDFKRLNKAFIAWMGSGKLGERPPSPTIEPWLNVPQVKHDAPLNSWWNIDYYAEVEKPDLPKPGVG